MLHNCYHSQGVNNGTQLEQGGFSLKSDLPPSHKKQFSHSLTFIYNFCHIFTVHTTFGRPSQWDCFCLFSWFLKAELLNCQALKQREFYVMKERVKCYTQLLPCRYSRHYEQDLFTLPSDLYGLRWISAAVCNDLLQIKIKNYNMWMLFYHKFRPSQRSNQENKLGSWQHILFWKNMLHYENSVWWNILKSFQDFTWPPPIAMKKNAHSQMSVRLKNFIYYILLHRI